MKNENNQKKSEQLLPLCIGIGVALGAGLGVSFGAAFGSVAMGVAFGPSLGVALGVAYWAVLKGQRKDKVLESDKNENKER